jgi:hypothetical protein
VLFDVLQEMIPHNEHVGTWRIPSTIVTDTDEFMHVGSDGKIVHFIFTDPKGTRVQAMKLWFDSLGENQYRVRGILGDEGWIIGMIPTESGMTIQREAKAFYMTPAMASELPRWYPARLEQALQEMSNIEADHLEP